MVGKGTEMTPAPALVAMLMGLASARVHRVDHALEGSPIRLQAEPNLSPLSSPAQQPRLLLQAQGPLQGREPTGLTPKLSGELACFLHGSSPGHSPPGRGSLTTPLGQWPLLEHRLPPLPGRSQSNKICRFLSIKPPVYIYVGDI